MKVTWGHTGNKNGEWEPLGLHLDRVASRAALMAEPFSGSAWVALMARWHDMGKYSDEFQEYLIAASRGDKGLSTVDHKTAGAKWAERRSKKHGRLMSYGIVGHHGGLPDFIDTNGGNAGLKVRLSTRLADWEKNVPEELKNLALPEIPDFKKMFREMANNSRKGFTIAFWQRMLFSCLVDADFLATEEHFDLPKSKSRESRLQFDAEALLSKFNVYMKKITDDAIESPVNDARLEVMKDCLNAGKLKPGFFSLTVPTGGGKTLASFAFALNHAEQFNKRRIISIMPFTSIIEQNAEVYRDAFGADAVLEHHSNLDPLDTKKAGKWWELASENWDSPIVVSTNVQFFESLFASKTSSCRKLHRIANSVIILDEAQKLPVELLKASLAALEELVKNYGCTVVLCSATQPAIKFREGFKIGLSGVREIVSDTELLYGIFNRVKVHLLGKQTCEEIAERLHAIPQGLCIVNTKRDAAELYQALNAPAEGHFHLSTMMCAAHRSQVIWEIKNRLALGGEKICRVVSTQLVESGVDLDFPVVYRAEAGLDSIAQAAGRCNREGRSEEKWGIPRGDVYIFDGERKPPLGQLRQAADVAKQVLVDRLSDEILSLESLDRYFKLYYWNRSDSWDKNDIMGCFKGLANCEFQFKEAQQKYRIINQDMQSVIMPWGQEGKELIELLTQDDKPDWQVYRKLQRFTVQMRRGAYQKLCDVDAICIYHDQFSVLIESGYYHEKLGLVADGESYSPQIFMV